MRYLTKVSDFARLNIKRNHRKFYKNSCLFQTYLIRYLSDSNTDRGVILTTKSLPEKGL